MHSERFSRKIAGGRNPLRRRRLGHPAHGTRAQAGRIPRSPQYLQPECPGRDRRTLRGSRRSADHHQYLRRLPPEAEGLRPRRADGGAQRRRRRSLEAGRGRKGVYLGVHWTHRHVTQALRRHRPGGDLRVLRSPNRRRRRGRHGHRVRRNHDRSHRSQARRKSCTVDLDDNSTHGHHDLRPDASRLLHNNGRDRGTGVLRARRGWSGRGGLELRQRHRKDDRDRGRVQGAHITPGHHPVQCRRTRDRPWRGRVPRVTGFHGRASFPVDPTWASTSSAAVAVPAPSTSRNSGR